MREVFNMGIGLVFVVSKSDGNSLMKFIEELNEKPVVIGEVE
jgi:phosphoribosylaminoimidazole (AIR) synthetase